MSTMLLVKEMEKSDKNPVLLYKPQGQHSDILDVDDFLLCLQTHYQQMVMKRFADNVVCIDSTYQTTGYHFVLTTVLVVDEFLEGYPVAWCLSTREDMVVLNLFFQQLKGRNGLIHPKWIMSDDADQFYNAWNDTFGGNSRKILCLWHVDRAWQAALQRHIKDKEIQCQVYHSLRTLLEEPNVQMFKKLLLGLNNQLQLSDDTEQFANYFEKYYSNRRTQWAICYRQHDGITTNMYLEGFHRVLKYLYMKGRVNKRVDKCMHILLNVSRDKAFERLIKLEKGKSSHKISCIRKRHMTSLSMSTSAITEKAKDTWIVVSSDECCSYVINKINDCTTCHLRCPECQVCTHQFSCTCPDSLIRTTICKHVHLLVRKLGIKPTIPSLITSQNDIEEIVKELQAPPSDDTTLKRNILKQISTLISNIHHCSSDSILTEINTHISAAVSLSSLTTSFPQSMIYSSNSPPTKKIQPQQPFYSKRKQRSKPSVRLAKPSMKDKYSVHQNLLNQQ
jgi:hypothetical protein